MSWLIDTDVLSEATKKNPNASVVRWLEENRGESYISSHVIAEIQSGISQMGESDRKRRYQQWLERILASMEGRILNFNTSVAAVWGKQEAEFAAKGCPMAMPDSFIAATARRHNLAVVTRNTADFDRPGIKVFNPFDADK